MKLTVPERIALLGVMPAQGNVITLRIIKELQSKLSFTEEELKHYGIKNTTHPDGNFTVSWNPELANETKDIGIGEVAEGIIAEQLKRLNSQDKLHVSMIPLYERFVEGNK